MEYAIGMRSPGILTAGGQLGKERSNEYGFRDNPIENGRPDQVADDLPESIRNRLLNLDLNSISPEDLRYLAGTLYWEGYISADAGGELGLYHLDHPGPMNLANWIDEATATLNSGDLAEYPLAIRSYQAGIDAARGIWQLVEYLKGRLLDVQA